MELVANFWPVIDESTGIIIRYFMRAYAMDSADEEISATLRALAPTDYTLATMFRIPCRFTVVSEHGAIDGAILPKDFEVHQGAIMTEAFPELEKQFSTFQGIASDARGQLLSVVEQPLFPKDPYIVTTTLVERTDGRLVAVTRQ
jgi:hypothetical protein